MTTQSKQGKINELKAWAVRHGYQKDRYGHYVKESDGTEGSKIRFVFKDTVLRKEVWSQAIKEWIRVKSGYYGELSITDKDQLKGMK